MRKFVLLASMAALGACSTIVEGTSQDIAVATDPSGANCVLKRQDAEIARVPSTPGSVRIQKTKYDITILCEKEGYQQAAYRNHSGADAATFGNILVGGLVGWAIDSSTGSDNKYDNQVTIKLEPVAKAAVNEPKAQ